MPLRIPYTNYTDISDVFVAKKFALQFSWSDLESLYTAVSDGVILMD